MAPSSIETLVRNMSEDFDPNLGALISLLSFTSPYTTKVLGCHYRGPEQKTWKSLSAASITSEMSPLGRVTVETLRPQTYLEERPLDSCGELSRGV